MEATNESPIILQMLKNVKTLIEVSKERNCWSLEELKEIDITEHNVSEIVKQLQEKYGIQEPIQELEPEPEPCLDASVEVKDQEIKKTTNGIEEMDEVD
jgi:hypothetical protein